MLVPLARSIKPRTDPWSAANNVGVWGRSFTIGASRGSRSRPGLPGIRYLSGVSDATWHSTIHVAAYFTFLVSLLIAYVVLTWGSWKRLDRASWRFAPLALLPWLGFFVLPAGLKASNYMFFAILFTPLLILAIRVLATGGWPAARTDARLT